MTAQQDWHRTVQKLVRDEAQQARRWLEAQLVKLQPGETWCEHQTRSSDPEDGGVNGLVAFTRTYTGHVLPEGYVCDARPVTQYGPAPEGWPPVEGANRQEPAAPEVGGLCRCLKCCCPPGEGHNDPRWKAYEKALRAYETTQEGQQA